MEELSGIIDLTRPTDSRDDHRPEIGGIVLTMSDPGLNLANEVVSPVCGDSEETVVEWLIPRDVPISEAPS